METNFSLSLGLRMILHRISCKSCMTKIFFFHSVHSGILTGVSLVFVCTWLGQQIMCIPSCILFVLPSLLSQAIQASHIASIFWAVSLQLASRSYFHHAQSHPNRLPFLLPLNSWTSGQEKGNPTKTQHDSQQRHEDQHRGAIKEMDHYCCLSSRKLPETCILCKPFYTHVLRILNIHLEMNETRSFSAYIGINFIRIHYIAIKWKFLKIWSSLRKFRINTSL